MAEETRTGPQVLVPANDNGDLVNREDCSELAAAARLDRVVLDIAQLIGRQLAREAFEVREAANDNRPVVREGEGEGEGEGRGPEAGGQPPSE